MFIVENITFSVFPSKIIISPLNVSTSILGD